MDINISLMMKIDITVLKKLAEVVNVVPVIAKADSLTLEERDAFKQRVGNSHDTGLTSTDPCRDGAPPDPPVPLRHRGER
jgi:hypothetical protein